MSAAWTRLPPAMAAAAAAAGLELREFVPTVRLPGLTPGRGLCWTDHLGRAVDVPDPAWVSSIRGVWHVIKSLHPQHPDYEAWRLAQALANRPRWGWGIPHGCAQGRVVHVVGNGPTAVKAIGQVGDDDLVIAINGALLLRRRGLPVTWWCMGDACFPPTFGADPEAGARWAQTMLDDGLDDVDLIAAACSYAPLVAACRSAHTWLGCHGPPYSFYRHLAPTDCSMLPTLVVGPATASSMIHLAAFFLRAREIVVWGLDCGVPGATDPRAQPTHAANTACDATDPWAAEGRPWWQVSGYDGPVLTCVEYDAVKRSVDASCLFAWDAGVPVWTGAGAGGVVLAGAPRRG